MKQEAAIAMFESLASGLRLEVYRLLVRMEPAGMVAGEIAAALDVPPAKLSFHLKALTQAGLASCVQEGRFQRYRANIPQMQALIAYLMDACCAGRPLQCGFGAEASPPGGGGRCA